MESSEPPLAGNAGIIALIFFLLILSMIFSASESAFLSINKLRLRVLRLKNDKKAVRIGRLLEKKDKLLNTFLVGNNIVNITITALITSIILSFFKHAGIAESSGIGIAAIFATVLLLIFGEIMPKTLGSIYPERTAFLLAHVISLLSFLLSLPVYVFTQFSRLITRIMHIPLDTPEVSFTEEEIKTFIDIGEEEGVLEADEKTMMHRVFAFTDLAASDIMTPRTKITPISLNMSYRDVLELAERTRFSCFPVCKAMQDADGYNIDDVAGVLYIKDMLASPDAGGITKREFSVKDTMREPIFIPGTKKMSAVQQILREQNQNLAIVIDEYSGTSGLLTTADIAASIFGKFPDAAGTTKPMITKINENELLVDGSCRLNVLSEMAGIHLVSAYYETVGGFMLEKCDRIPQTGDAVTEGGYTLTVTQMSQNKVQRVHILQNTQNKIKRDAP